MSKLLICSSSPELDPFPAKNEAEGPIQTFEIGAPLMPTNTTSDPLVMLNVVWQLLDVPL